MFGKFRSDRRGNYAMLVALAMVPIMGSLALAVDYAELSRERRATLQALDATNIATAWQILQGASNEEALKYAQDFFVANLGPVDPENAKLHVVLPDSSTGGGTLKMSADLTYKPYFYPVFQALRSGSKDGSTTISFNVSNEVRLKNTLEVALVLDNSGSMDDKGSGSGKKRIDLLKAAAKQLVDTLAGQAGMMKQVSKPVQFGVVPFAASVNIGAGYKDAPWMDTDGLSSIHHENFDWNTMKSKDANKRVEKINGVYYKMGKNWGTQEGKKVTRFTLFEDLKSKNSSIAWAGCVEMRPYPYSLDDTPPSSSNPDTLFVPMFAPDEADASGRRSSYNSWLSDVSTDNSALKRQIYMPKYYTSGTVSLYSGKGPNQSCTTKPITPLTDVTTSNGLQAIKDAIDAMHADGATNVSEGLAWGWRVVSGRAPFTEGRGDNEKGNDKVVIVLTDGANTYYTPDSLGAADLADNKSTYSNYGYAKENRIFAGTTVSKYYSNSNYTKAMKQQMLEVCENAKAGNIILMTVALDLSTNKSDEQEQIAALKECASYSRFRKDPDNPSKQAKLFWNATGANLADKFKEIADELSNLRIVS